MNNRTCGSQQHLTCPFMPACLRCRILVDTKVLMCVLCCSVQGRLKAVLLCLRYVDTMAFGPWFVPSWYSEEGMQVQKQKRRCLCSLRAERLAEMVPLAFIVSKKRTSPAVIFTSRLVHLSTTTWTEKSACVANLPHSHKHTRTRFLLLAVAMPLLLYCGRFWCCYYYSFL